MAKAHELVHYLIYSSSTISAMEDIATKELLTVVTRKGQVTVPSAIRHALGLKQGDKVAFTLEEHVVVFRPVGSVVGRTAGVFKARGPVLSAEQLRERAEQALAAEATPANPRA
ncbi:MAG: AbrB/MazE/SpoVT family DNA-binding domain-containing protein [Chloroflexota bacterium]